MQPPPRNIHAIMLAQALELCAARRSGRVIALTGAGISAESGIPTFRGKEGYWTVGAREYRPQELATFEAFEAMPEEVWAWYLYRRGVCRDAAPNPAHLALAACERALGDRFALVTQNVDGLHRRAGNANLHEIHGNIDLARCAAECTPARFEVAPERTCPRCGGPARPHVLWFDESYDEERYHLHTVRTLATRADLLIVVGTSAQTNLPWQVVRLAADVGAAIIDVNVEDNPFAEIARSSGGAAVRGSAVDVVPRLVETIAG
jgi:NAD-dependent deacetylase